MVTHNREQAVHVPPQSQPVDTDTCGTQHASCRHAFHALGPLWSRLTQALPQVRFPESHEAARSLPHAAERDGCLLYRRIIEIRDAQSVLRPYASHFVAAWIDRQLLDSTTSALLREAGTLATALEAYRAGQTPGPDSDTQQGLPASPCGHTLLAEATWLTRIGTAMDQSPIVELLQQHPQRARQNH